MSEGFYKATKYMNAEDALLAREDKSRKKEKTGEHTAGWGAQGG